jgi:hypothetical protein
MNMTTQSSCPSEFALERWRFGEIAASGEESSLLAHVEQCPTCRQRVAGLAGAPAPSASSDAVWSRAQASGVVDRASPEIRAARWRPLRWSLAGLAAAAVVTVSAFAWRHPGEDILLKGSAWHLGVIAKSRDGAVMRVDPGAPLAPGDRLRFEVTTSWPKASSW